MNNVITFPAKDRVEIHYGIVTGEIVTDASGTRPVFDHVGEPRFFIDLVDADGGRLAMWDGESYDAAIIAAGDLSREWGCAVVDMVVPDTDRFL